MTNTQYKITIKKEEDGLFHAYSADFPECIISSPLMNEAHNEMQSALIFAIEWAMERGDLLPLASGKGDIPIYIPAKTALKIAVYSAWKQSKLTKTALATLLGRSETEVRRILSPKHGTKLDQLEETARALGKRLVIELA